MGLNIRLYYACYYTHFSFLLFILGLMLPFEYEVKGLILINSIIVGIVGNILFINDYPSYVTWFNTNYPGKTVDDVNYELAMGNFVFHTIPMLISFFMLLGCNRFIHQYGDIYRFIVYFMLLFLVWILLPHNGNIGYDKLTTSYPNSKFLVNTTVATAFCTVLIVYLMLK